MWRHFWINDIIIANLYFYLILKSSKFNFRIKHVKEFYSTYFNEAITRIIVVVGASVQRSGLCLTIHFARLLPAVIRILKCKASLSTIHFTRK